MIELENVGKRYGTLQAIDSLTVSIPPGAVGLLGPNGAGKSTLLKVLLGLVRISAGRARVLGLDAARQSRRIRELVGFMPEDDCLFSGLQGIESVAYAGELAGLPARTALRRGHEVLDFVGIADERYRQVQTYSTGMKQKIKLAQALVHSPKLVLLDEPTSGLDPQGRDRMLRLIRDVARQEAVNVVVSTHILKDVETCCDAVLILGRGRLMLYDTIERLRRPVDESLRVHYGGNGEAFLKSLESAGCRVERVGPEQARISRPSGGTGGPSAGTESDSSLVFRAAASCGATVRQMSPSRNSLEEIFLKAISENGHADL